MEMCEVPTASLNRAGDIDPPDDDPEGGGYGSVADD